MKNEPKTFKQVFEMITEAWRSNDVERVKELTKIAQRPEFIKETVQMMEQLFPGIEPTGFNGDIPIYDMRDMAKISGVGIENITTIAGKITNSEEVCDLSTPRGETIH